MRTNGYIQVLQTSSGGFDDNGEPILGDAEWSESIPCHIQTLSDNRKSAYEDGRHRSASFSILMECPFADKVSRVNLVRDDEELGEYDIISYEGIPGMGRVKIIV